jgi:hypothetical protein
MPEQQRKMEQSMLENKQAFVEAMEKANIPVFRLWTAAEIALAALERRPAEPIVFANSTGSFPGLSPPKTLPR